MNEKWNRLTDTNRLKDKNYIFKLQIQFFVSHSLCRVTTKANEIWIKWWKWVVWWKKMYIPINILCNGIWFCIFHSLVGFHFYTRFFFLSWHKWEWDTKIQLWMALREQRKKNGRQRWGWRIMFVIFMIDVASVYLLYWCVLVPYKL